MAEVGVRIVGEDQASSALRSVAESSRSTAQEVTALGGAWDTLGSTITSSVVTGQAIIGLLQGTLNAAGNATAGLRAFAQQTEQMNQSLEGTRMSFSVLIGSSEKANALLDEMKVAARSTVLSFEEFRNASKYLLGFQFDAKDVVQITKDIGSAVYALGAQNMGGMERIIRALGQMKAQGRVSREELNQLSEVGVPALKLLADGFGVTTEAMSQMVKAGTVPVEGAISALLGQMHQLYGANTEQLSKSFEVMTSNFGDFVDQAQQALGAGIFETNKRRLQELTQIVASPVFIKIATELGGRLGDAYRRFNDTAVFPAIQAVQQFMNALDINNPNPAIMSLFQNMQGIMENLINNYLGGNGVNAMKNFMAVLNQLASGITTAAQGGSLVDVLERISTIGQDTSAGRFVSALVSDFNSLVNVVQSAWPSIKAGIDNITNGFGNIGRGLTNAISSGDTQQLTSAVTEALSGLWTWIDTWGSKGADAITRALIKIFNPDYNDGPFEQKVQTTVDRALAILSSIGTGIANSFGESLFPMLAPRLEALSSFLTSKFTILVSGLASYLNDKMPGAFQIAFGSVETASQDFLDRLGFRMKSQFVQAMMPNLAGSQVFADYMANENVRIEEEARKRNEVLTRTNAEAMRELQQLPSLSQYFPGLNDVSGLNAQLQSIQDGTAITAVQTGKKLLENVEVGATSSASSVSSNIASSTESMLVNSADNINSSGVVANAWEKVGQNIASSVGRGYESGYTEFTQRVQTSLGIPEIYQQLSQSVTAINQINSRVYNLETGATGGGGSGGGSANVTGDQSSGTGGSATYTPPASVSNAGSARTNKTNNVTINITSGGGSSRDLQAMAQYLMIRSSFDFN